MRIFVDISFRMWLFIYNFAVLIKYQGQIIKTPNLLKELTKMKKSISTPEDETSCFRRQMFERPERQKRFEFVLKILLAILCIACICMALVM